MATKKKKTKKTPAKKAASKKAPAKKAAPKKKTASKKAAKKVVKKKATAKKAVAKKAPAKKVSAKKAPAKKAAPAKAPTAKKVVAAKAPAAKKPASEVSYAKIAVSSQVPTVTLLDQSGHEVDLGEQLLSSPWTVLYFYPKDDTPGCTKQACSFRDHMNNLIGDGVQVLGVSPDSPEDHRKFIEKYDLNFTLLSDTEKKLIGHFGLWRKKQYMGREYMGVERTTLLLKGDTVAHVWQPVSVEGHVEDVVSTLGKLRA
jgi:thioredoxin-dependent peroxiredoxin